ncbi:hypothetical protein HOG98_07985 [bacterium]|nr:hypothetical protein [bacterium]
MSNSGGIGIRQSVTPGKLSGSSKSAPAGKVSNGDGDVATQLAKDLDGLKISTPANRDFLPGLEKNLQGLVEFFDQIPEMLNVDVPSWEEPPSINITQKNCSPDVVVVSPNPKATNLKASFKELLTDYKSVKSELKEMLQELKKGSADSETIQSDFEEKLGELLDYGEVIQDKIDAWQEKNEGKEKTSVFKKMNGLQAGLASDFARLSRYSSKIGDSVKTNKSPVYDKLKNFAANTSSKAAATNNVVLAQPNVNSLPNDVPKESVLPEAKDIFKVPYKEEFETQMSYLFADTAGSRETKEMQIDGLEYNKTDNSVCIHMDSVDGLRSKSVELPFADGYEFKSMEDAENIIAKGSLDRGKSPKELLGSKRLFNKLKNQASAELEKMPGFKKMDPDLKKSLLTRKFNEKYQALVKNLKPTIVDQLEQIDKTGEVNFEPVDKNFKMTSTKVKTSWLSSGLTIIAVGSGKSGIKFKVTTTKRKEFSYKDTIKQRSFTADNPVSKADDPTSGSMSVVAKGGKLFFKGKAGGKDRIKALIGSDTINVTSKKTKKQLSTVTEIKSTIPKKMFEKCLPQPKSMFSIATRVENKVFKKAEKSVGLTRPSTFGNLIKEDLWPTSTQNKSILGKLGVVVKLLPNLAYTLPIGLIVNAVIMTSAHSKGDSLKLQSTMKSFKGNYETLTKNLLGEVSRGTNTRIMEMPKAVAQSTTSVGKTVKFAMGSAFKNMMKDKFKEQMELFDKSIQETTNVLGVAIPDSKAEIEEMERLIDSGDFKSAEDVFKLIDQKLTSSMNKRTKALGSLIDQMQEKLLPAAKDASKLKSTLINARATVNELTGLYLKSANSVQSIRSDLITGTVEILKNDDAMSKLGSKGAEGKVKSKVSSFMKKMEDYESRKSGMDPAEKKDVLNSIVSEFKDIEAISENGDNFMDKKELEIIMNSLEGVMKPLESIMKTYQSDIEVFSKEAPNPYQGMESNIDFQISLLEDVDAFKAEMNDLPNMVAREFKGSPHSIPLDMNEINQKMVSVQKEMFEFLNKPDSKDDKAGFDKILTKLRNLETLTQTKTLQVDSLTLNTKEKNEILTKIKPEIRRLLKNNQENIQDIIVKFMSMDVATVLDAKGDGINAIASETHGLAVKSESLGDFGLHDDMTTTMLKGDMSFGATVSDMSNSLRDAAAKTNSSSRKKALQTLSKSFEIAILSQREDKLQDFMSLIDSEMSKTNSGALKTMEFFKDNAGLFRMQFLEKFGEEKANTLKSVEKSLSDMGLRNFEVYDCFENKTTGAIEVSINTWEKGTPESKRQPRILKLKLPRVDDSLKFSKESFLVGNEDKKASSKSETRGTFAKDEFYGKVGVSSEDEKALRFLLKDRSKKATNTKDILNKSTYAEFFNDLSSMLNSNEDPTVDLDAPKLTVEELESRNEQIGSDKKLKMEGLSATASMSDYSGESSEFGDDISDRGSINSAGGLSVPDDELASVSSEDSMISQMQAAAEASNKFSLDTPETVAQLFQTDKPLPKHIALFGFPEGGLKLGDHPKVIDGGDFTVEIEMTQSNESDPIQLVYKKTDKKTGVLQEQELTIYNKETAVDSINEDVASQYVDLAISRDYSVNFGSGGEGFYISGGAARAINVSIVSGLNNPDVFPEGYDTSLSEFEFQVKQKILETPSLLEKITPGAAREKIIDTLTDRFDNLDLSEFLENSNRLIGSDGMSSGADGINASFDAFETLSTEFEETLVQSLKETIGTAIQGNETLFDDELGEKMDELKVTMRKKFLSSLGAVHLATFPSVGTSFVENGSTMDNKMKAFSKALTSFHAASNALEQKSIELSGAGLFNEQTLFKTSLADNIGEMYESEGTSSTIRSANGENIENSSFTLSGLVAQKTLEFSSNFSQDVFGVSNEHGEYPTVGLNQDLDFKMAQTSRVLNTSSNMDKLSEKLTKMKNSKPQKEYLKNLPDNFSIISIRNDSIETPDKSGKMVSNSYVGGILVSTPEGKEILIEIEPDENFDENVLKDLTGILEKTERKPTVKKFEDNFLNNVNLALVLNEDPDSFGMRNAKITIPIMDSDDNIQGISIEIEPTKEQKKRGMKPTVKEIKFSSIPSSIREQFSTELTSMWSGCINEEKNKIVDSVVSQLNTRSECFGSDAAGQQAKGIFNDALRQKVSREVGYSMEAVQNPQGGQLESLIVRVNEGVRHNSIAKNTNTDNLFHTAAESKERVSKTCNESLAPLKQKYENKVTEFRKTVPKFVQDKMKDLIGADVKVDSVRFDSNGNVTDIMIVKKNSKDGIDRVVSFRDIGRVKKGVKDSASLNGSFDKLLDSINKGVQSRQETATNEELSNLALAKDNAEAAIFTTQTIAEFNDESFSLFKMRPTIPSAPTKSELAELRSGIDDFSESVLTPLNEALSGLKDGLEGAIPPENRNELFASLEKGNSMEIRRAINKLPPELKILFKRLAGAVHMIKEKTDALSEAYGMSTNNFEDGLQLDDDFVTNFVATNGDATILLDLAKHYGTVFNNKD